MWILVIPLPTKPWSPKKTVFVGEVLGRYAFVVFRTSLMPMFVFGSYKIIHSNKRNVPGWNLQNVHSIRYALLSFEQAKAQLNG